MAWRNYVLVPLVLACLSAPSQAGIIFNRNKPKTSADQLGDLVKTLRSDSDERNRAAAAEDLAKFDAKSYPAATHALIEALMKDGSAAVRHEAAQSLGKVRPLTNQGGLALEHALKNDNSTRVRITARTALWQYHLAGYRGGNPDQPQTTEPGLAAAPPKPNPAPTRPTASRPGGARQSGEPPLAATGGSTPGIRIDPPATLPRSAYNPAPSDIKIGPPAEPPLVIAPPRPAIPTDAKPEPAKPVKPAAPAAPARPAKPDDDGPVLIPPV